MAEKITLETRGNVLLMGVNRPEKRNAFDVDMYHQLALAYAQLITRQNANAKNRQCVVKVVTYSGF